MLLSYNTNGLANHSLLDAIDLLAEIGYQGIAITLDHGALNPFDERVGDQLPRVASALQSHGMCCVIETGARFLLDPRKKHEPTLVSSDAAEQARRVDFLCRAIQIAARLKADCVSLWSGVVRDGAGDTAARDRLIDGLARVLECAEQHDVRLAFEPEPGMLIDRLDSYRGLLDKLVARRTDIARLLLTIDIGHLHCQGETPIVEKILAFRDRLANIHIEDMRAGVHEHLAFGDGEINFPPVIAALAQIGYAGLVSVELSRHSHEGPAAARKAYNFLRPLMDAAVTDSVREDEAPAGP
jgi:sugar phosphate isomerase/epimerase